MQSSLTSFGAISTKVLSLTFLGVDVQYVQLSPHQWIRHSLIWRQILTQTHLQPQPLLKVLQRLIHHRLSLSLHLAPWFPLQHLALLRLLLAHLRHHHAKFVPLLHHVQHHPLHALSILLLLLVHRQHHALLLHLARHRHLLALLPPDINAQVIK
jgi:hypothetical protein